SITIHEGRNRQIRRMLEAVGHRTLRLKREGYGPLTLGELKSGEWRYLTDKEVDALLRSAKQ
ncbi:MAG: pseudouridine synthase, partial [Clostridia bacterium]|nr:pseudouridine synthase [Clostridia bacterium]